MTYALQSVCLSGGNSHKTNPDVFCNFINLYISKRPSNAAQRDMHNDVRVLTVPLYADRVVHDAHQALLNCMHDGPNRLAHNVTNCLQRGCAGLPDAYSSMLRAADAISRATPARMDLCI